MYESLADLDLRVDSWDLETLERDTSSGFTRTTTVVSLHGDGYTGRGEDVTYDSDPHYRLVERADELPLGGSYTFDAFAEHIGTTDLFLGDDPESAIFRSYRHWAVESAALDLALKQAETSLGARLGREYDPVRFVVSTRLADPPTGERVTRWLDRDQSLEFKLDPTDDWSADVIERLAATDAVRILDLKGQYEGTDVDQAADPALYELILDGFADAVIEDPALTDETRPLFADERGRVSWDYPIRGVETVESLPWEPDWLNIKPSRFGSVESLLATIEYCNERDITMYGGGQFELGAGRQHLHALASLFYPDSPNDVAPRGYNVPEPGPELSGSPLSPPATPRGLEW
ncbi:hypothetical protein [Halovenus salina]|uniref:hypothetical protein n=1 Tax=Halovenus salina TaxID=1510225 RepID=UPI002260B847|nr:hypothetical protein [Halovenus salina]